jgi:kynurenine formamidase
VSTVATTSFAPGNTRASEHRDVPRLDDAGGHLGQQRQVEEVVLGVDDGDLGGVAEPAQQPAGRGEPRETRSDDDDARPHRRHGSGQSTARTALFEGARRHAPPMTVLSGLLAAVDVVDLTTPLQSSTPILELPPPFANTHRFELESCRATTRRARPGTGTTSTPASTPAPTSTPRCTGSPAATGSTSPRRRSPPWSPPAVVIDMTAEVAQDADFLLEHSHIRAWEERHGALPDGGWLLYRTGGRRAATTRPPSPTPTRTARTPPGVSPDCARWLAEESPIAGFGVETVAPTRAPRTRSSPRSRATPR